MSHKVFYLSSAFDSHHITKECIISHLSPEQITEQDLDLRVQGVWDQEGIVPRPFSQLHSLCPLPGCGLHHLWVHEAGPPSELVLCFYTSHTWAQVRTLGVIKQIDISASFTEWLAHFVLNKNGNFLRKFKGARKSVMLERETGWQTTREFSHSMLLESE